MLARWMVEVSAIKRKSAPSDVKVFTSVFLSFVINKNTKWNKDSQAGTTVSSVRIQPEHFLRFHKFMLHLFCNLSTGSANQIEPFLLHTKTCLHELHTVHVHASPTGSAHILSLPLSTSRPQAWGAPDFFFPPFPLYLHHFHGDACRTGWLVPKCNSAWTKCKQSQILLAVSLRGRHSRLTGAFCLASISDGLPGVFDSGSCTAATPWGWFAAVTWLGI